MNLQLFTQSETQSRSIYLHFLMMKPPRWGEGGEAEPTASMHILFMRIEVSHEFAIFHAKRDSIQAYLFSFLMVGLLHCFFDN